MGKEINTDSDVFSDFFGEDDITDNISKDNSKEVELENKRKTIQTKKEKKVEKEKIEEKIPEIDEDLDNFGDLFGEDKEEKISEILDEDLNKNLDNKKDYIDNNNIDIEDDGFGDLFTNSKTNEEIIKSDKDNLEQKEKINNNGFENMFGPKKVNNEPSDIKSNIQEDSTAYNQDPKNENSDKKKKAIIGIVVLFLIIIGGIYSYTSTKTVDNNKTLTNNTEKSKSNSNSTNTEVVDINSKISDNDAIKKVLEEYKSKGLSEDLKKTNLEIKDIKVLDNFNGYKENNLNFILVEYQPILTDDAITNFLVNVNKASQEQVKQIKDSGKFEQVKVLMVQYYEKQYGELLKTGTLGALYKKGEGDYSIIKLGDYFKERFYNSGVYDVKTKTMMEFIASYINYDKNYFGKDKEKVLQLSNLVIEQLKTEEGKKFLSSVNTYFLTK